MKMELEEYFRRAELPFYEWPIDPANTLFILKGNEFSDFDFAAKLKRANPDGYIIGCGCSTIWNLIEGFPIGVSPKGMVFVDVDPRVVCYSKMIIALIKLFPTAEEFLEQIIKLNQTKRWLKALEAVIDCEKEATLQKTFRKFWKSASWMHKTPWLNVLDKETIGSFLKAKDWYQGNHTVSTRASIIAHYSTFHHLAVGGKMAAIYRDFLDGMFLDAIAKLPEFKKTTSLIYISNLIDHRLRGADIRGDFASIVRFTDYLNQVAVRPLERLLPEQPANFAIVDTLKSHAYRLRFHRQIPRYLPGDFLWGFDQLACLKSSLKN